MIIKEKLGNINDVVIGDKNIDTVLLEWHETGKRILHKHTQSGTEITFRFLKENQNLTQGDIIYEDEKNIIAVGILSCDVIIIRPTGMQQMASVCYEIGNKHMPLFFQDDELLVPFEAPIYRLLDTLGYDVEQGKRKLINPLKSTVSPHAHSSESLFSKILKLTGSADE